MKLLQQGINKSAWLWQLADVRFHLFHGGIVLINGQQVTLHLSDMLL